MKITLNPYANLGAVSSFQMNQNATPFEIKSQDVDSKETEIELSRKKHAEFVQSSNAIFEGATPTQLVNTQTNSITISKGVYYRIGTVNGKPLNGTPLTGGGFNSNFSPQIFVHPDTPAGTPLTPEQLESLRIHKSYSQQERQEANKLVSIFMSLVRLADGKTSVESMNTPEFTQNFPKFAEGVGLDLTQPFSINGKSFVYSNGELRSIAAEE
ncbi:hypothetical protein [Lysinibacillus sp. NPDC047702]|uniref:hypothetical protein n=1 Tax=unclassified Lysinibacillus TaxID=2636778 RepID=UPI003D056FA0